MCAQIRQRNGWYVIDDTGAAGIWSAPAGRAARSIARFFRELAPRKEGQQAAVLEEEFPTTGRTAPAGCGSSSMACRAIAGTCPRPAAISMSASAAWRPSSRPRATRSGRTGRRLQGSSPDAAWSPTRAWDSRRLHLLYPRPPGLPATDDAYLAGDAAGLATTDLAEGIGPAVQSGLAVADAIAAGTEPSFAHIGRKSLPPMLAEHGGLAGLLARGMGWA